MDSKISLIGTGVVFELISGGPLLFYCSIDPRVLGSYSSSLNNIIIVIRVNNLGAIILWNLL